MIVKIVDCGPRISEFVSDDLDCCLVGGMGTLKRASVMMYRQRSHDQPTTLSLAATLQPRSTLPHIQPRTRMTINDNGVLLRVFIGESDQFDGKPLHEAIVKKVRELGLAGAPFCAGPKASAPTVSSTRRPCWRCQPICLS